ncbi:DEAD/DEAH box helicase [Endozoicomonas sp. G2_2]|uniref:DEAD/DEAH box helicase n=1 Tax=Endozoicomonas sp. G2_2 TaxID=2821092 RepID=UPI001ADA9C7C|nr:DEAD/DEAH box helicase [Endozoicomonas sp. G2_2]MBO9470422.1 DEAD/DEAH box helicase [Endozoicomonas sp. G2_2]
MPFDQLGLAPSLLEAVAAAGYSEPTPIQAKAIPAVLDGQDVLAAAQTGTGKTAAFTLPLLHRLGETQQKKPRVLVLAPTRELAAQVNESVRTYGKAGSIRSTVIFGGVGYQPQIGQFKKGVDIVVATPGRLLDLLQEGHADLSNIETLVLDEADRMLDMGFIHDIKRVLKYVPEKRQTLLFSATFSKDIRKLASNLLNKPVEIDVAPRNATADRIDQKVVMVEKPRKRAVLSHLIKENGWHQVLVFARTKHGANRLCKQLDSDGLPAAALHGNKSQNARTKALDGFKDGKIQVLVATDIAARGIDIESLPYVVNFELPNVSEDYVHRIGRTGRAGEAGEAVSLVGPDERKLLKDIEKLTGKQIERMTVEGVDLRAGENDEPDERPARRPNNKGGHGNRPPKRGGGNNNAPGRNQQRRRSRGGKRGGNRSGGGGGGQS